jgi:sugar O-acyltransferase (sialic acid O-acetyltransferase NeuD family)
MKKAVIWGSSGHALVVAHIMRLEGRFEIAGMIDDFNPGLHGSEVHGLKVLGGRERLGALQQSGVTHLVFGFGDCGARLNLTPLVEQAGFQFASAIHPAAMIADKREIGAGTVVVAGAVINPGAKIGRNCIINTGASVDHECVIGDGAHIGPGARLGGRVAVAEGAWVAMGAIVLDRVRIGAGAIVGAGAVITKDVPAGVVVYGNPGRIIRTVAEQLSRPSKSSG